MRRAGRTQAYTWPQFLLGLAQDVAYRPAMTRMRYTTAEPTLNCLRVHAHAAYKDLDLNPFRRHGCPQRFIHALVSPLSHVHLGRLERGPKRPKRTTREV